MKLTKTLRMHIDTFFNKISPEDLHTISKEKYSFEELGKILEDDRVSFGTAQMLKDVKFPIAKGDLGYFCVLNDTNPSWSTTPEEIYTVANYIPAPTLSIAKNGSEKAIRFTSLLIQQSQIIGHLHYAILEMNISTYEEKSYMINMTMSHMKMH